jgi:glyoxylase-like metal-dependent hydrolase (beta-lactamase superfamily II)
MPRLLVLSVLLVAPLAQAETPFEIRQISPHVWTARPARTVRVNATSTIIVGQSGLTVVEAQADPTLARQLLREVRGRISKQPVHTLIFTHAHLDHVLGAQTFVEEYPDIEIVAHANTRAALAAGAEEDRAGWLSFMDSSLAKMDRTDRQYAELRAYTAAVRGARVLLPTRTFSESITLHDGLDIDLRFFGGGHTDGDIVVAVPADRVLVTGDLVHGLEPLFQSSHPREWLETLRALRALPFDILIGGHGDSHDDKAIVDKWIRYVEIMVAEIEAAKIRGESFESAHARIEADLLRWLRSDDTGSRIQRSREALMTEWLIGSLDGAVHNGVENAWRRLPEH